MLLISHIIIALSGLIIAAASIITGNKLHIIWSRYLTAGTLLTGTILVINSGNMLKGCLTGLAYLAGAITLTEIAQHRMAKQKQ